MSEAATRSIEPTPTCTEAELAVVKATAELWNAFLRLPNLVDDDVDDVRFHVHALQSIAAAVFVARTAPGFFDLEAIVNGSAPRTAAGSIDDGRLTDEEQRDQATRCSCRGSDDLCPCQNAPDRQTRRRAPRDEGYAYIERMYGRAYRAGMRVRLENTDRCGTVARMKPSAGHHVQVRFDGEDHASPCHPDSLTVLDGATEAA